MQNNYEKHAPRVSQVIAAVAKVSCKHGLWLVARVNKKTARYRYFVCNAQSELTFFVRKNKIKALILHFIDCILTGCYDLCVKNK